MTEDTPSRRGRQLPTAEELRIWRDFVEAAEALRARIAARLQQDSSLSPGDYVVLLALSEARGARMRPSDLASAIGWERSRLSHHLGRMERRELVRREECAADSRGTVVVLEPAGAEAFRGATFPHLRAVRDLFVDALTPRQLDAAGEVARALRARLLGRDVVEVLEDAVGDPAEGGEVVGAERVDDQAPDGGDVVGRGGLDGRAAGGGDDDEGAAAVLGALLPGDQATLGHPGDLVGQAALLPVDRPGQLLEPQAALGDVGEGDQDLEVGAGELAVRLQVADQGRAQLLVQADEAAPGVLLGRAEPVRLVAHAKRV